MATQNHGEMQKSIWDGDTIIASRSLNQSIEKVGGQKGKAKSRRKEAKTETIPCSMPGCNKLFISNQERDNHIDFNHTVAPETTTSDLVDWPPADVETTIEPEEDEDDTTILARAAKQEETIKPKLTAASLQALENSTEADPVASITQSFHNASIRDGLIHDTFQDELPPNTLIRDPRDSAESVMSLDETTYSVVDDALEDEQVSEISIQEAPEIFLATKILLYLWAESVNDNSRRSQRGIRQHAPRAGSQGQRSSFSVSKESLTSAETSSEVSGTPSLRRKRESDDGDGNVSRKNPKRNNSNQPQERPFACPFNKFDSYRFGNDPNNPQYNVCSTWCDGKTAYLKQHLVRTHCYSEFSCDRCFNDFKNHAELRAHRRLEPPCALGTPDESKIMPEHQAELVLRTRNSVGLDRTTYWYRVYDTVFGPGARRQRPVEPYYTGPYNEILQQFVHFAIVRIPDIIPLARQRMHLDPNTSTEYDAELGRTVLQEAMQFFMSELTRNRQPSIQQIRDQNTPAPSTVMTDQQTMAQRDITRPLQQLRPANWYAALPMHAPQQALHTPQIPLQNFQQAHRSIVSAPTTPSPAPTATFSDPVHLQQQFNYDTNIWPNQDPSQFEEMMSGFDTLSSNQGESDEYDFLDGFGGNHQLGHPGRQERRLPE